MQRKGASKLPDPLREAVGLPLGEECEYFVGGTAKNATTASTLLVRLHTSNTRSTTNATSWVANASSASRANTVVHSGLLENALRVLAEKFWSKRFMYISVG